MSDFYLDRVYLPAGTISAVTIDGLIIYGVERLCTDQAHPCIPQARYRLERHHGPKAAHGPIWAMVNEGQGVFHSETMTAQQLAAAHAAGLRVRTNCLFGHAGNDPDDVEGCVAFGLLIPDWTKAWVSESHDAVIKFQAQMAAVWTPERGVVIRERAASGAGVST